jgi:sRNA-binding regulator protein Hfq
MSVSSIPATPQPDSEVPVERTAPRKRRNGSNPVSLYHPAHTTEIDAPQRHAELFYLQKQIQSQTPMVVVLEDGERVEGCIEWYDRNALKIRGHARTLVYKSAIKYMYKLGDMG